MFGRRETTNSHLSVMSRLSLRGVKLKETVDCTVERAWS